jgi:hypothetical protein
MSLLRTIFQRVPERLRIVDERQHHLLARYGGGFHIRGLTIFGEDGRLRGFVFSPTNPSPARIQSFVAGARREGLISEELVRVLFARIKAEDFVIKQIGTRDLLVFPADIYHSSRSAQTTRLSKS